MNKARGFIRLIRLERAISAAVGVILTGIIVKDLAVFQWDYVIACLSVFFSTFANFALNDYHDLDIDVFNKREDRPLANGVFNPRTAVWIAAASCILAYALALQLRPIPRVMIMAGLPVSLAYNLYLKRYLAFKNLFTGLANVGVILVGALVLDNNVETLAWYLAFISFFFSISYEVMLDIADVKGDLAMGVQTIPGRFGTRKAAWLSVIIGIGAVFVNPLPFFIQVDPRLFRDYLFLGLVMLSVSNRVLISRELLMDQSPENVWRLKKRLFRNLQMGGITYLIGFLF
jgi:4-hydroxybenzoate polyprenyltransferase